jgi:general secretion pathway protein D
VTAANSNRLETLRRQYQDRLAGRVSSNAPVKVPTAALPATPAPVAVPTAAVPAAAVPAAAGATNLAPAVSPAAVNAGSFTVAALNDANDPATNRLDFPAVDVNTFLTFYAEFVGRTILRPAGLPAQQVTLRTQTPLTRREAIQAMDTVLAMNGITTILVGEKFVKVVQTPSALQEAAQVSTLSASNLPEAAQYVVQIVQLKYVRPSEIQPVLLPFAKIPNGVVAIEGSGVVVLRDFAENVKRMLQIIEMVDIAMPAEFIQEVIPIKYAKASEIASALGSLGSGGSSTSVGGSSGGTGSLGGGMGGGMSGSRSGFGGSSRSSGFGSRGGMGNYQGGGMGGMGGMSGMGGATAMGQPMGAPGATAGSFSDRLRSIISKASSGDFQIIGPNKILADENSNQLLVFATREDMKMIKDIISKLDTISPQVLIEALLLKVDLKDNFDLGFDYIGKIGSTYALQRTKDELFPNPDGGPPPLNFATTTNVTGAFNWFGKINDNFYFRVKAAASAGRVSVLQRPRIQTSHAQAATFFSGGTTPYPTGTSYGGYGGNYSQIQQMNIGTTLNVVPLINQDGLVVLEIQQQISRPGATVKIEGVGQVPSTTETSVSAKVSVRTGETIALGGFISSDSDKSKGGVPLLMDLPLLGALFRSTANQSSRTELIILIRPTVLPNPQDAAIAAAKLKESMPLLRTAEVELQTDWERYQKIADEVEAKAAKRKDGSQKHGPWDPNAMKFDDATNTPPATAPNP